MIQQQYIDSGILEAYVTGTATDAEVRELMYMKAQYPEVNFALQQLELDMEHIAQHMAIAPPAGTWNKISDTIDELILRPEFNPGQFQPNTGDKGFKDHQTDNGPHFIEVEAESNHMKIHKNWKWVFAAVFILGKIFLGCAIYFYLENRQAQQQVQELKTELKQLKK
ncbi:hypothetical protein [Mucilaginibacter psychrotolerans]|uniref:Anti-sigma factor n=1 Tax=Mucilaginibacter psychrotolerans TaxID=1524096 RepID=A0A4Y8S3W9_9SPHI|nr:hypothetical protein [Mucilaginibacter psychrotolerans]TFF33446.1 hypothetical protein E2R66_25895 [Mucilaginibacter psychrotolerans]